MYIQRHIEKDIEESLQRKEIIAIVGARQVGKTTTIKQLLSKQKNKKINQLNFDNVTAKTMFTEDIESFIDIHIKNYDIVFIDEIQYVKESGKILKYIYDNHNVKLIISGSSATELSIQSIKYLVGRIFVFTLYPFNFEEYVQAKKPELIETYKKGTYKETITKQFNKLKEEFFTYGGYPACCTETKNSLKQRIVENIYNTYLFKEIKELLHLAENNKLVTLLQILALQTGKKINYTDLAQETEFSIPTLKKYLNILEKTYIIKLIKPFYTNKKKEIIKNPKIYFIDNGFRNACLNNFSKERVDIGEVQEQHVVTELIKKEITPKFWNTKAKAEVDIIIEKNNKPIPIEIKTTLKTPKTTRSFMNFIEEYKPEKAIILSNELETTIKKQEHNIKFLPIVKLNIIIRTFKEN